MYMYIYIDTYRYMDIPTYFCILGIYMFVFF